MEDKLIAGRLEAIAKALETGRWSKETTVEELRFIARELYEVAEMRHRMSKMAREYK